MILFISKFCLFYVSIFSYYTFSCWKKSVPYQSNFISGMNEVNVNIQLTPAWFQFGITDGLCLDRVDFRSINKTIFRFDTMFSSNEK